MTAIEIDDTASGSFVRLRLIEAEHLEDGTPAVVLNRNEMLTLAVGLLSVCLRGGLEPTDLKGLQEHLGPDARAILRLLAGDMSGCA